jgi:hypothetical protein
MVVPKPEQEQRAADPCAHEPPTMEKAKGKRRYTHVQLLARVFAIDLTQCLKCKSQKQKVEWFTEPAKIKAILQTTGQP